MRRTVLTALALVVVLAGFRTPALAQGTNAPSIDLQLEMQRKRTVVPPRPDVGPAAKEAEAAAERIQQQRQAEELGKKAMQAPMPPLDESVVEGSRARQLQDKR
jgi:hypothetical protein